jgi:hypothetical protein
MNQEELLERKNKLYADKMENIAKKSMFNSTVTKPFEAKKAENVPLTAKGIDISIVANTPYFLDSDSDVVMPNAFEFDGMEYPELDSHDRESIESLITWGKFRYGQVARKDLLLDGEGTVEALIFDAHITPQMHKDAFDKYSTGLIRQHSLSFYYKDVQYACNEEGEDWREEKALWDSIYPMLINKDLADNIGHFWVVNKGEIREVSACVFGASRLTSTLSVSEKKDKEEQKPIFNYNKK